MYKRSKTYKRRWNYLPAHRDFARRGYSRLDGKIDPFIFFPPYSLLFLVCIAREPVGIRTGSTDLGPLLLSFFFFALLGGSERRISASRNRSGFRPPRLRRPLFFLSPLSLSLFLLFAFLSVSPSPLSRSASYLGSLPRSSPSLR